MLFCACFGGWKKGKERGSDQPEPMVKKESARKVYVFFNKNVGEDDNFFFGHAHGRCYRP